MILDTLDHLQNYRGLSTNLDLALEYLRGGTYAGLADGRHEVGGGRFYAMLQTYGTKADEQCRIESHRKYIDIQVLLRGRERFGYAPVAALQLQTDYDSTRDVMFHSGKVDWLELREGRFIILFPQDAHQPCAALPSGPAEVHKLVLKVAVA